jgi:hypothetical protein
MLSLLAFAAVFGAVDLAAMRWGRDSRVDDGRRNW